MESRENGGPPGVGPVVLGAPQWMTRMEFRGLASAPGP